MLNYNVPDLSGVKLETKKIPLKDINENSYYDGQVRFLISQEMELSQLKEIKEKYFDYLEERDNFPLTKSIISELDKIAPHRKQNPLLLGWQGYFNLPTKNPFCMMEEILHITSCYIPLLAKSFLFEWKGRSLKQKMFLKREVKGRTTKPRFPASDVFWKDIKEQLGSKYLYKYVLNTSFADVLFSVQQLTDFNYTLFRKDHPEDKGTQLQRASLVCALLNIFDMDDKEFTNNPPQGSICKKFNKREIDLIKKYKEKGGDLIKPILDKIYPLKS